MIECRGRNGWFVFSKFTTFLGKHSHVYIYSKILPTNFAPIYLTGPPDEMIKLFEDILSELKKKGERKR